MEPFSIVAAGGTGSGDLVVGLLIGCVIGVLIGPAFRSWQMYREWADASREAGLADRLLERMELDDEVDDEVDDWSSRTGTDDTVGSPWRTRH
jgi:hypothetical protein